MPKNLMKEVASDDVLEQAYLWVCDRRKDYSHNDEVWSVRYHWREIKLVIQLELLEGSYSFSSLKRIHRTADDLELWSAQDALVLKAIAIVLTKYLAPRLSKQCTHIAGNGGAKAAVREVLDKFPENKFVFRTDVKSYYGGGAFCYDRQRSEPGVVSGNSKWEIPA